MYMHATPFFAQTSRDSLMAYLANGSVSMHKFTQRLSFQQSYVDDRIKTGYVSYCLVIRNITLWSIIMRILKAHIITKHFSFGALAGSYTYIELS